MLATGWEGPASYPDIPVMVWWTPFTGDDGVQQCGQYQCYVTNDRRYRHHPSTRAIFFYGTDFKPDDVPVPRKISENWALLHEESPKNNPIFAHRELIRHFNFTSTFKQSSDLPLTTQYLESVDYLTSDRYMVSVETKSQLQVTQGLAPVAYVQSGCDTPSARDQWVEQLMKYIPVDSYGTCLNNKPLPSDLQGSEQFENEKFLKFLAQYKFVIAYENAICDDYVTEKLWRTLAIGSVPVYMGASNIETLLPNTDSAVLVKNFQSTADVAEYLHKVNSDDEIYKSYLRHKTAYRQGGQLVTNTHLLGMMSSRR